MARRLAIWISVAVVSSCSKERDSRALPTQATTPAVTQQQRPTLVCPPKTHVVGDAPPTGTQQFCELDVDGGASKRHGPLLGWHDNGQKMLEAEYENGKLVGPVTMWSPNGAKVGEGPMNSKGERHGHWTEWNPEKKATLEGDYVNGTREGSWSTIVDGLRVVGPYKKDKAQGLFVTYVVSTGEKSAETMMAKGEIISMTAWSNNGATSEKCTFKSNEKEHCELHTDLDKGEPTKPECDNSFRAERPLMDRCVETQCRFGSNDWDACNNRCADKRSRLFGVCYRRLMREVGIE